LRARKACQIVIFADFLHFFFAPIAPGRISHSVFACPAPNKPCRAWDAAQPHIAAKKQDYPESSFSLIALEKEEKPQEGERGEGGNHPQAALF
jgi:hypothetical protein